MAYSMIRKCFDNSMRFACKKLKQRSANLLGCEDDQIIGSRGRGGKASGLDGGRRRGLGGGAVVDAEADADILGVRRLVVVCIGRQRGVRRLAARHRDLVVRLPSGAHARAVGAAVVLRFSHEG